MQLSLSGDLGPRLRKECTGLETQLMGEVISGALECSGKEDRALGTARFKGASASMPLMGEKVQRGERKATSALAVSKAEGLIGLLNLLYSGKRCYPGGDGSSIIMVKS